MPDTWDATSREYIEGREEGIVNNHAQYVSIVRTGIGKNTLVIGGEVDAGTAYLFCSTFVANNISSMGCQAPTAIYTHQLG